MERGRGLAVAGVLALAAVDVVLVAWAYRPSDVGTDLGLRAVLDTVTSRSADPAPAAGAVPVPSTSSAAGPSPGGSSSPAQVRPVGIALAGVDEDVLWLAETGSCERPGEVHVTRDGGATWSTEAAPAAVVRVRPTSPREAFVTGGGDGCDLGLWSSGDGGGTWQAGEVDQAWSRTPDDARGVHLPTGGTTRPCGRRDVLDLAPVDGDRADVACADGAVRTTRDAGATWTRSYEVDGLLALALTGEGEGLVAAADDGCDGVRLLAVDADGPVDAEGVCVDVAPQPGRTAVAVTGAGTWLVVGDTVLRSAEATGPFEPTVVSPLG